MTGRRLLDAAAIFRASRDVAAKHVALRQHQLDLYSKTSSLAKVVKSQTDRVTLTVKAASDLAKRFNEPRPDYSTQAPQPRKPHHDASTPGQNGASELKASGKRDALSQDHFHERSVQNAPSESQSDSSLRIRQEEAKRYSLQDGTIFPANPGDEPTGDNESSSDSPQTAPPKASIADKKETYEGLEPSSSCTTSIPNPKNTKQRLPENVEDAQDSEIRVFAAQISQDIFYPSDSKGQDQVVPHAQAVPKQQSPSNEMYSELFHSPRIARMLGGQPKSNDAFKGLEMSGAQETPVKQTKRPQKTDQAFSNFRTSKEESQDRSRSPATENGSSRPSQAKDGEGVQDLAADIVEDAAAMPTQSANLDTVRSVFMISMLID